MKIIVSRLELLAALLFASKDESRFTLASVCLEVSTKSHKPTIIATDWRRLVVIQSQAEQAEEFDRDFSLLLQAGFVRAVCSLSGALGGKIFPWIEFEAEPNDGEVQVKFIGGNAFLNVDKNAVVEGEFPNWRKCVPDKKAKRSQINDLGINSEYVGDFAKASKALGLHDNVIQMNLVGKDSAVEVKLARADYFYGLVMPCKTDESVDYQPEFLNIVKDLPVHGIEAESEDAEAAAKMAALPVEDEIKAAVVTVLSKRGRKRK